ncbi:hypothetical protein VSR01_03805 [Actinacidiphila sp. DG2A-62]|uniref:class III lanthionine synthetase LanKC N-terminal domain-containing protein n=1 Tax=Actinacidiphila sp. DG2A-62 TaxID=3108821 RepID=UPI002DB99671|nr:hypothetical protein [Actinacidiphila sp. DG2A-62]MEC3992720.1 hypothetical protein [Actinacidiphila sp. DG2A-62]
MSIDVFTLADPDVYLPPSAVPDRAPRLRPGAVPPDWSDSRTGWWTQWAPAGGPRFADSDLRVHADAYREPLQPVLDAFAAACFALGVPFRHVTHPEAHRRLNHPRGSRAQAGRFAVAAPADAAASDALLRALRATALFETESAPPTGERRDGPSPAHLGRSLSVLRAGRTPDPSRAAISPDGTPSGRTR